MEVNKETIGKSVYFIDRHIQKTFVVEYGKIAAVVPKYCFRDKFSQDYARSENILISTLDKDGTLKSKVVNDASLVFETVQDVLKYCNGADIVFGYSAFKGDNNDSRI